MQYSIQILRHSNDDTDTIADTYISADQAIDALLYVQGLAPVEVEEEVVEDELDVESEPAPAFTFAPAVPTAPRQAKKRGSRAEYDKEALTTEIVAGKVSNADLVEKYGVTLSTIYQIKHKLKHADPVAVADDAPPETAYAAKQRLRAENPEPDTNIPGEIRLAFTQGFSLSEVSDMYPMVPLEEITRIKNGKI